VLEVLTPDFALQPTTVVTSKREAVIIDIILFIILPPFHNKLTLFVFKNFYGMLLVPITPIKKEYGMLVNITIVCLKLLLNFDNNNELFDNS
jgi:hypothetical protein